MKTAHIEICDSRRVKGAYFVRLMGKNGKKLSHSENLESRQAVNKNIAAQFEAIDPSAETFFRPFDVDKTKSGYWAKKYGITHKPGR